MRSLSGRPTAAASALCAGAILLAGCAGHPAGRPGSAPQGAVTSAPAAAAGVLRSRVDRALAALARRGFTGSVIVTDGPVTLVARNYGHVPGSPRTALFDIGSAAKTFTAAAVLLLAQRGRLHLQASVADYLPGVPLDKRPITVSELLEHGSGLPAYFSSDRQQIGEHAAVRAILRLPLGPSGRFRYSNAGYTLLAAIVQRVSGQPFRQFVARNLLRPAGLRHTGWYGRPPPPGTEPANGTVGGQDRGPAGTQAPGSWATLGAGGMTSTAADLLRWMHALADSAILTARTRTLMLAPRLPLGNGGSVAFGWVVGKTAARQPIRTVGGDTDYGFTSDLREFPAVRIASVILASNGAMAAENAGHSVELALKV
jgi:CubicO group peptidase (beta-lactamase class C family)